MRGLIRQHQFDKVELVKFTTPETSYDELEASHAPTPKQVLQLLGLPYRTVLLCTGDMGFSSAKTYDIEVWLPEPEGLSRDLVVFELRSVPGAPREHPLPPRGQRARPSSCTRSTVRDSRSGARWIAILENYQQADGSVVIPEALRPFMGGREVIAPAR